MKTLTITLPEDIDFDDKEAKMILATRLYEKGKLTLGQAAELAGLTKEAFMIELGNYGISIFGETLKDIDRDLRNG